MRFSACFLVFFLAVFAAFGQDTLRIDSDALGEERTILIDLPASYHGEDPVYGLKNYPIMIILDGERLFELARTVLRDRSRATVEEIPEMILLGVVNTDRRRDMLPFGGSHEHGAANFLTFLDQELLPQIDTTYRSTGHHLLVGHSYGGMFSCYALAQSDAFQAVLAIDPSLHWADELVVNQLFDAQWRDQKTRRLYLAKANNPFDPGPAAGPMGVAVERLRNGLDSLSLPGLDYQFDFFPEEDHFSLPLISLYQGLRFLCKDHRFPLDQLSQADQEALRSHHQQARRYWGADHSPPAHVYLQVAFFLELEDARESSLELLQFLVETYPGSVLFYNHLATVQGRAGKLDAALMTLEKALAIDPENEYAKGLQMELREQQNH